MVAAEKAHATTSPHDTHATTSPHDTHAAGALGSTYVVIGGHSPETNHRLYRSDQ
mgnify:CR=1 FL=1